MDKYKNILQDFKNQIKSLCQRIQSCEKKLEKLIEAYRIQENQIFKIEIQKQKQIAHKLEMSNVTACHNERLDVTKVEEEMASIKSMSLLNHHMIEQLQETVWRLDGFGIEKKIEDIQEVIGVQAHVIQMIEEVMRLEGNRDYQDNTKKK